MLLGKYLNYNEVHSFNMRHNFVVGRRGKGKTWGITGWVLKQAINNDKPFIWTRNTKAALDELTKFDGLNFLSTHPELNHWDRSLFKIVKGALFYDEKLLGIFLSLGNFFSIKGIDYNEYKHFVFDEFMPERREAKRVDYDYALQSIMQTVFRERTDFKAFYTANVLQHSSTILDFFGFSITPIFPDQVKQLNKKLNAAIFYLQNAVVETEKAKATGDAFAQANIDTEDSIIINYEDNIDKHCGKDLKRKERMMYLTGDRVYFLVRDYNDRVAIIPVKKPNMDIPIPMYALDKKLVFGSSVFDNEIKKQMLVLWNNGLLVFKSHYALYQFHRGLFAQ